MKKFHNRNGGGRWEYLVPHTGLLLTSSSFVSLSNLVRNHLDANGFKDAVISDEEIEHFNAVAQCKKNPELCFEVGTVDPADRRLTIGDAIRFTRTLFLNLAKGGKRVDQDEANRRAAICASCSLNRPPEGCKSCSGSGIAAATVGILIGDRKTIHDESLQSCQVCGCFNKVQVHFPLEDLQKGSGDKINDQLPSHCWKKYGNS